MIHVSWPKPTDQPYEIDVLTDTANAESTTDERGELDRFEDLAREHVTVPEADIANKREWS